MARILLIAVGSRGDVSPYLGLASGLTKAGHTITIATHKIFEDMVLAAGFRFAPMAGNPREMIAAPTGERWVTSGRDVLRLTTELRKLFAPIIKQSFADCLKASGEADLLMPSRLALPAVQLIASNKGIAMVPALLQPFAPTSKFGSIYSPVDIKLPGPLNFATHLLSEQIYWLLFRKALVELAAAHNFAPPQLLVGHAYLHRPSLLGVSQALIAPDTYPGGKVKVTGYWFPPDEKAWIPPRSLVDFLREGDPPVCIGFGSMRSNAAAERLWGLAEAFQRRGKRVLILSGWSDVARDRVPSGCFVTEEAPHAWLLPQVLGLVHHGGAGTTAAALRAGKPSLVTPFFADQHFWARRLYELRLGPAPARLDGDPQENADALISAAQDAGVASRLTAVRNVIAAEDGPGTAASAVSRFLGN